MAAALDDSFERVQLAVGLGQCLVEAAPLFGGERVRVGDDDRPFLPVELFAGAVAEGARHPLDRGELLAVDVEQLAVVVGRERTDHAKPCLVGQRLVVLGVVALVVDERELGQLGVAQTQIGQALLDQLDRVGEVGGVVAAARIGLVTERDVRIKRHAQRQPDQPQVPPAALRMPTLGDRVALIGRVDERREVGRVVDQRAQFDSVAIDAATDDLALSRGDHLIADHVHRVPEPLRAQRASLGWQQPHQRGALMPVAELTLGARLARPVDRRQCDHLPDRQSPAASADGTHCPVDRPGHLELPTEPERRRDRAEAARNHRLRLGVPSQALLEILRATQIHLAHNLHPTLHPRGLTQVVVRPAVDHLLRQARHDLGHTLVLETDRKTPRMESNPRIQATTSRCHRTNLLGHTQDRCMTQPTTRTKNAANDHKSAAQLPRRY